jgi:hypothetical protein
MINVVARNAITTAPMEAGDIPSSTETGAWGFRAITRNSFCDGSISHRFPISRHHDHSLNFWMYGMGYHTIQQTIIAYCFG